MPSPPETPVDLRDRRGSSDDEPWGPMEVVTRTSAPDGARGGTAVVLLHGWGAPGDDLVPLADALMQPGARFFVPAAPLVEGGGGRAWWRLDPGVRPAHAFHPQPPRGYQSHRHVLAARAAVSALAREIRERHAPDRLVLAGFSQGAMLAIDAALAGAPVDRVVALSGVLLVDSLAAMHTPGPARPKLFLSHGRRDDVLSFRSGERAGELLAQAGYDVTWRPFDGGHEIPAALLAEVRGVMFAP